MRRFVHKFWSMALRPLLAWFAACWVAGMTLFVTYLVADNGLGEGISRYKMGLFDPILAATLITPFVALLTAVPALVFVYLARRYSWRRGQAEFLVGAILPFGLLSVFFASQYNSLGEGWAGVMVAATFIPAGITGGVTYWWLGNQSTQ